MPSENTIPLAVFAELFSGHIRQDACVVQKYDTKKMPWVGRCNLVVLLDMAYRKSRCGIVDLLDPKEWDRPQCGDPNCRCALRENAVRHNIINYFRC